ncbi:MAG: phosphoglycerate kinase [Promethearchaeati archaeon SRVP18_Atabeyarchaeia-1]
MSLRFLTLDDVEVESKRVLVRVDINSPMKPGTEEIMDDSRFVAILDTLKDLEKSKVAILAHQGRPGESDFTSMRSHFRVLQKYVGSRAKFVEDIIGPAAIDSIQKLKKGDVLLLDNARLLSEEVMEGTPELFARTQLVRRLSPLFDLFVNDAYPAAHRAQASMVGFPEVLTALAGRSMERELKALNKALYEPDRPSIFVLGGAKVPDKLKILANILEKKKVDRVLLSGLMGIVFLEASGINLGEGSRGNLKDFESLKKQAKDLLARYRENIMLPRDVAVSIDHKRVEIPVDKIPKDAAVKDIGEATIKEYTDQILKAKTILANGPPGVFEDKDFAKGTQQVLKAMAQSKGFSVIGGGHLAVLAKEEMIEKSIGYVSTGGGATMAMLAGQKLPGVEALYKAAKRITTK